VSGGEEDVMVERVAVVTDSTAYLPDGVADSLGVRVVPLRVSIGTRTATDGVDVTALDVANALRDKVSVTTSRPAPSHFAAVFQECLDAGATRVVSVNLAAALSGTWESAALAAQDFEHGVVRVVDSRSTAMALGFAVMAAAQRAAAGASAAEVQGVATETVDRTRTLFYVDTLEYLRRGGRIGNAAAMLATSLSVKPLLQMVEGHIVPLEKVRTSTKAIARLVQLQRALVPRLDRLRHGAQLTPGPSRPGVGRDVRRDIPDLHRCQLLPERRHRSAAAFYLHAHEIVRRLQLVEVRADLPVRVGRGKSVAAAAGLDEQLSPPRRVGVRGAATRCHQGDRCRCGEQRKCTGEGGRRRHLGRRSGRIL